MPLDPSIILGVKPPQIQTPFELRAQMAQFEQADHQNMLAKLKMREYQDGVTKKNRLQDLMRSSVTETPTYGDHQADNPFGEDLGRMKTQTGTNKLFDAGKYRNALYGEGMVDEGMAFDDNQRKQEAAVADLANKKLTGQKTGIEVSNMQRERSVQKLGSLINDPKLSREMIIADLQSQLDSGELKPEQAQSMVSMLPSDPQEIREFLQRTLTQILKPNEQFAAVTPKIEKQDFGGTVGLLDQNPNSPTFGKQLAGYGKTQSPDSVASVANSANTAKMTDTRTREFNDTRVEENQLKREAKDETLKLTKASQVASIDTMLGTLDRLGKHPGLARSVGVAGAFPTMPGSESANFQAELDTFQSQAFIPMVSQLKGMGALSDAEGKKLTQAVGALSPKMGEKAFRDSITRIVTDMNAARARVAGTPQPGNPDTAGMEAELRRRGLM